MNSPHYISQSIIRIWSEYLIPSSTLPIAFALIRYYKAENIDTLLSAALPLHLHLRTGRIKTIPAEQLAADIAVLETAVEPYRTMDWLSFINKTDRWYRSIKLFHDLLALYVNRPYQPDPSNGINLRAFSMDSESVHRSSTQNMLIKNMDLLKNIPIHPLQDSLNDVYDLAEDMNKLHVYDIFERDYKNLHIPLYSGTVSYSSIFDHLWSFILKNPNRKDLYKRLMEEIEDGMNVCANGKLARLMNVVEGYLEGLTTVSNKELFQNKMADISRMEPGRQKEEAKIAFHEFNIPEEEQGAWLDALD